jgi:hypothetical protein
MEIFLSVKKLAEKGLEINIKEKNCEIRKDGKQIAITDSFGKFYKLRKSNLGLQEFANGNQKKKEEKKKKKKRFS